MTDTIYLRPTAFVDAPFGYDGRVARLAGGMSWFSAVEIDRIEGNRRVSTDLVPVEAMGDAVERLGETARTAWINLTTGRPPLVDPHNFRFSRFSDGSKIELISGF